MRVNQREDSVMMLPSDKQLWESAVFLTGVKIVWGSMAAAPLIALFVH